MLYNEITIIQPSTFALIQELQAKEYLNTFYLVDGTALALQIGHRYSIDIDLFTQNDFDSQNVFYNIKNGFDSETTFLQKNTLMCLINNVKAYFIKHPYPFVNPPIHEDGISFLSCEDIAAMKVNAIINSGQRYKDFIDIFYLLELFTMDQIIGFYLQKYELMNPVIPVKALSFFDDINFELDAPILKNKLKVEAVKKRILNAINNSKKIFK